MRLLLDTHTMFWWLRDDPKLGSRTKAIIASPQAELFVSVASFWELSVKARLGKMPERGSVLFSEAEASSLTVLAISGPHLQALEGIEARADHKDPFDLLILAQAIVEDLVLVTRDAKLKQYGVRCL